MLHAHAVAGSRARQRAHPFNGPRSAAQAPEVAVSGSATTWQPALTGNALQSQVQVWVQPSASWEKPAARHEPTRAAAGATSGM